jgi:hypothetical protein
MNVNSVIFHYASIGDYLFLIMIVFASIIQAISQNKKKKAIQELSNNETAKGNSQTDYRPGERPGNMTGPKGPFDNIFDSADRMIITEPDVEKHIWGDDYPETVKDKKKEEVTEILNTGNERVIQSLAEKQTELIYSQPVTHNVNVRFKTRIRDGFSLKKAVIYSEILNRKYC